MKVRLLTWNTLAEKLTPMGELVSGAKTDPGCVGRIAGVITHHNPDGRPRASCSAGDWGSPAAEMHVAARLTRGLVDARLPTQDPAGLHDRQIRLTGDSMAAAWRTRLTAARPAPQPSPHWTD